MCDEEGTAAVISGGCALFSFSWQLKEMLGACGACQQRGSVSYVHVIEAQSCIQWEQLIFLERLRWESLAGFTEKIAPGKCRKAEIFVTDWKKNLVNTQLIEQVLDSQQVTYWGTHLAICNRKFQEIYDGSSCKKVSNTCWCLHEKNDRWSQQHSGNRAECCNFDELDRHKCWSFHQRSSQEQKKKWQ